MKRSKDRGRARGPTSSLMPQANAGRSGDVPRRGKQADKAPTLLGEVCKGRAIARSGCCLRPDLDARLLRQLLGAARASVNGFFGNPVSPIKLACGTWMALIEA